MVGVIVVAVDGSDVAAAATTIAAELAAPSQARLVLVHVFEPLAYVGVVEPPVDFAAIEAAVEQRLTEEWCAPCRDLGVSFTTRLEEGEVVDVLLGVADEENADLIVVGSRGLGGFGSIMLGSKSQKLLHRSRWPVLVVPPGRSERAEG